MPRIVLAAVALGSLRAASGIFEDQGAAVAEGDFIGLPGGGYSFAKATAHKLVERVEVDHEGTMMKLEGPGVIWRIWSAMPKKGAVKFYVDGSETPVLEGPFIEMFNNCSRACNRHQFIFDL